MSEPAESGGEQGTDPTSGVLGNLPRTRPSVRSPRRAQRPSPAASSGDAPRRAEASGEPDPAGADLEALARGGIAIAGGAASLGLRIAGRAAAAVRDAVERR